MAETEQKGFTLIELLIAAVIISIIFLVTISWLKSTPLQTRDSKRVADIQQVQLALERYYNDNNQYPQTPQDWWVADCRGSKGWNNILGPALAPYLRQLPNDPLYPNNPPPLCYAYKSGDYDPNKTYRGSQRGQCPGSAGAKYTLIFTTEDKTFPFVPLTIQPPPFHRYCLFAF